MSAPISPLVLAALGALTSAPDAAAAFASQNGVPQRAETPGEAARAALKEAPRRSKIGRIRGLQAISEVRFQSSPDNAYRLVTSFGIPERARVVLSSDDGSFARFQLGSRLFGWDSTPGSETESYVLAGTGLQDTLFDVELRRALFFWPGGLKWTGAGRTFTAKVRDLGVIMVTTDQESGLPKKIQSFGQAGGVTAEFREIEWGPSLPEERAKPKSFTFAVGGEALWTEKVQSVDVDWRFADTWFLPADRLTAVLGSELADRMRIRALPGAWVKRIPVANLDLPPAAKPSTGRSADGSSETSSAGPVSLSTAMSAAAAWNGVQKSLDAAPEGYPVRQLAPYVSLLLDGDGAPVAAEYESAGAPHTPSAKLPKWDWRAPKNIWGHPLAEPDASGAVQGFDEAAKALALTYENAGGFRPARRLRFRIGEELIDGEARVALFDLALTVDVTQESVDDPEAPSNSQSLDGQRR